jgi:hypothetical protein
MNQRGWSSGIVRPPLQSLTHRQREELGEVLDSILAAGKQDRRMPRAAHA